MTADSCSAEHVVGKGLPFYRMPGQHGDIGKPSPMSSSSSTTSGETKVCCKELVPSKVTDYPRDVRPKLWGPRVGGVAEP